MSYIFIDAKIETDMKEKNISQWNNSSCT